MATLIAFIIATILWSFVLYGVLNSYKLIICIANKLDKGG